MLLSLSMSLPLFSQNIAAFSGTKHPTTATVPNITAEPLSRGPGLTAGGGNTFNSGNWATGNKLDQNDYIQWSVTAERGYIIHINEFQISVDRDPDGFSHFFAGNGPAKIRIRSSMDNYKSDLYANDKISNSGQTPNVETSLTSSPGGTIVFRLYGFSSNIGMLGDLGTLDIEGELGTVLGLENTGIRLSGQVTYDGLLYTDGKWTPHAPSTNTTDKNALIRNGIYSVSEKIAVKNLQVSPEAGIVVQKTGAITVHGNMVTSDNVVLQSDSHSYSSLIAKDTVIGRVTYQRQVDISPPFGGRGNETLLSAPVTGEPFNVFKGANPNLENKTKSSYIFGPYDNTKQTYATYSKAETAKFSPATGYRAATVKNGSFTYNGMVHTDTINKNILSSGSEPWNLIGNPYPSYLNLKEFLTTNKNLLDAELTGIYSYQGDPANGWQIRNLAYLTVHPNAMLTPGEGFMVAAKKGGGKVTFTPEMRSVGNIDQFEVKKKHAPDQVGFLKLNLTDGKAYATTDFYFNKASTTGFDSGYDAGFYTSKAPKFSVFSHVVDNSVNLDLAIQSLPYSDLSEQAIIPLGVNAIKDQPLTIQIKEWMLPKETEVYLEDQLDGSFTLLNTNDYSFFTHSDLTGTGRFFLHILNSTLAYGNEDSDALQVYTTNRGQLLHIQDKIASNALVTVFDLQERLLLTVNLDNKDSFYSKVDLSALDSGMYLVKVKTGKLEKIKKIRIDAHSASVKENIEEELEQPSSNN